MAEIVGKLFLLCVCQFSSVCREFLACLSLHRSQRNHSVLNSLQNEVNYLASILCNVCLKYFECLNNVSVFVLCVCCWCLNLSIAKKYSFLPHFICESASMPCGNIAFTCPYVQSVCLSYNLLVSHLFLIPEHRNIWPTFNRRSTKLDLIT